MMLNTLIAGLTSGAATDAGAQTAGVAGSRGQGLDAVFAPPSAKAKDDSSQSTPFAGLLQALLLAQTAPQALLTIPDGTTSGQTIPADAATGGDSAGAIQTGCHTGVSSGQEMDVSPLALAPALAKTPSPEVDGKIVQTAGAEIGASGPGKSLAGSVVVSAVSSQSADSASGWMPIFRSGRDLKPASVSVRPSPDGADSVSPSSSREWNQTKSLANQPAPAPDVDQAGSTVVLKSSRTTLTISQTLQAAVVSITAKTGEDAVARAFSTNRVTTFSTSTVQLLAETNSVSPRPEAGTGEGKSDPNESRREGTGLPGANVANAISANSNVLSFSAAAPASREAGSPAPAAHVPTVADQVAVETTRHAQMIRQGETTEFSLRLDPPNLGTVHVHLRATENGLSARFVVADDAARQALENQMQDLRSRLSGAGVALGSFDVFQGQQGTHPGWQRPDQQPRTPTGTPARKSGADWLQSVLSGVERVDVVA